MQFESIYWVKTTLAVVTYSQIGSCIKAPTKNIQISTTSATTAASASDTFLTFDSIESETTFAGAYTTDSTKSTPSSASDYSSDSTKSETPLASSYTTDSAKSEIPSASADTAESRTKNQTNNNSTGLLLTSSPSADFNLYSNSSNTQPMSSLSIVGGMASMNP